MPSGEDRTLRRRLLQLALLTWPRQSRNRHARALEQTFEAAWNQEAPARPGLRRTWRRIGLLVDLLTSGLQQRMARPGPAAATFVHFTEDTSMRSFAWDLRSAVRALRARPLFTAAVVVTLGLGLGSTTAIFSVVEAVLLRPLPYPDDERLVVLGARDASRNLTEVSWPAFEQVRQFPELEAAAAYEDSAVLFGTGERLERVDGAAVSPEFFATLGVRASEGRTLLPGDPPFKAEREIVLGHDLWRRQFDADPAIVGRAITLEGRTYTVVGIMPPEFAFPAATEFWRSLGPDMRIMADMPSVGFVDVVGRLTPAASVDQLGNRFAAWLASRPDRDEHRVAFATSLRAETRGGTAPAIVSVFAGVGLLLAVACANVAALFVANGRARRVELDTRAALGASRGRLVRQLLLEGVLLALAGSLAALAITRATRDLIVRLSADQIPRIDGAGISAPVLAFTVSVGLLTAVLIALGPAWSLTRARAALSLGVARTVTGSRASRRVFAGLVALEFALAVVLVAGAGLLMNSYRHLLSVDRGMSTDRVGVARVVLPLTAAWRGNETRRRFFEHFGARLRALPGVEEAGFVARLPLDGARGGSDVYRPERPDAAVQVLNQMASPGYFEAVGARRVAGRFFTADDGPAAPPVVVLNDLAAARLFGDPAAAVGQRITFDYFRGPVTATVAGVIGAIRYESFATDFRPEMYLPVAQGTVVPLSLVYRAGGDPGALVPAIRRLVAEVDPDGTVALDDVSTLAASVARVVARPRFFLVLVGVFATLAFLLAACGIYGVTAYWQSERWRELGLRVALGASPRRLVRSLVARGTTVALAGIGVGLGVTWLAGGLIRHLLFGVEPGDPRTLGGAAGLLVAMAIVACWLPARRAAAVDPAVILRTD